MLIVLLLVFVALVVVSAILHEKTDFEFVTFCASLISIIASVFIIVLMIAHGAKLSEASAIDERIALYEEANCGIDSQITEIVTQYKDYEAGTFEKAKGDSTVALVTLYPELKSNELVQSQMEIYVENQKQILKLKEEKISLKVYRWWLYFGN